LPGALRTGLDLAQQLEFLTEGLSAKLDVGLGEQLDHRFFDRRERVHAFAALTMERVDASQRKMRRVHAGALGYLPEKGVNCLSESRIEPSPGRPAEQGSSRRRSPTKENRYDP